MNVRAGREKGWHAPQLKRGGEQLDGRVEQLFGEQLTRLGGLLVGEHERVVTRSHAPRSEAVSVAVASRGSGRAGEEASGHIKKMPRPWAPMRAIRAAAEAAAREGRASSAEEEEEEGPAPSYKFRVPHFAARNPSSH